MSACTAANNGRSSLTAEVAVTPGLSRVNEVELLNAREDRFGGVIVTSEGLPQDPEVFARSLEASLTSWKQQGKKGVWLQLPTENANLVQPAIQAGFQYHHAEVAHVMLTKWLPGRESTLPPNASHQVGVGAFVLNNKREVLAVQERNGPLKGTGIWKLPTGLVNQEEDICDAAVREVEEETGVKTEFLEVISFRQAHKVAFGKSDLFFVCALRPLTSAITVQELELEAAQWMSLGSFLGQPFFQQRPLFKQMMEVCVAHADDRVKGFKGHVFEGYSAGSQNYLYHGEQLGGGHVEPAASL